MRIFLLIGALFIYTTSISQTKDVRTPPDFSKLKTSGAFDITMIQSEKNEVILFGEKETTSKILTVVEDGKLTIKPIKGFKKYKTIKMEIHFKAVEDINIFGSGDFTTEIITVEPLKFSARGSGDQNLNIQCPSLDLNLSGSGDFRLFGKATSITLKSFGSGHIHAFEMTSESIILESKGSGDLALNASGTITGEAFGSGDIECIGGAKVDINAQGSGTISTR